MSKLINCGYSGCIQAQRIKTGITSSWLLNLFFKYKSKIQTMFQYVNKNIQFAINVIVIQKDVLCSCCCLFFIGLVKKVLSLFWDGRTPIFFYQWCFFFFKIENNSHHFEAVFLCLSLFLMIYLICVRVGDLRQRR